MMILKWEFIYQTVIRSKMIQKVIHSFGSLTMIRILSRVFEFILKTYLIRNLLDKQVVAHMLQLDLIITVSLHIIKSCLKPAYQKVSDPSKLQRNIHSGMNLMNIGIVTAGVVSLIICGFQLYHYENLSSEKRLLNLNYSILLYGLSAVNEALFEKYNVRNVLKYDYIRSAMIQMSSFLPKTLFIFVAAQLGMFQQWGILVFGIGHFLYTFLLFLISFFTSPPPFRAILSTRINNQDKLSQIKNQEKPSQVEYIDNTTKQSAKEFFTLSLLKLAIQEFQKIALVTLDISSFSSTYTLIGNLGSIVVRYIFAPLEEVVYNYFSRGDEKQSLNTLILLVKSITLFSCLSLTFGYNFSEAFLGFLYGGKWVEPDSVSALQVYTVLLSFLGINGIMEAFLFAKGGKSLQNYKYISVFPTSVYVFLSFYFIRYLEIGTRSFFLANTVSMVIRIIISWNLEVKKHIDLKKFLLSIKPSNLFIVSLVLTFLLGNPNIPFCSIPRFNGYFQNMLLGGFLFGINIIVIAFQNKAFIKEKIKKALSKQVKNQ